MVTSAIIGASRPEQLDATVDAATTTLPPELLDTLDDLTRAFRYGDAER